MARPGVAEGSPLPATVSGAPLASWLASRATEGMLLVLVGCLVAVQARDLLGFGRLQTDEDQTLLWSAGRELLHLHLREPNFYGQRYNTTFEAIPGAVLHALGLSLGLAMPLGTTLLVTACWLVLAAAAWRTGNVVAAAAALALPVCLRIPYLLLADAPRGVVSGDLLAALAVAAALAVRQPRFRLALVIAAGGLAYLWDNAAVQTALPAAVAVVVQDREALLQRPGQALRATATGAVPPVAWFVLDKLWYATHPIDITTTPTRARHLDWSVLPHNLHHLGPLLGFYELELWPRQAVLVAVFLIILGAAVVVTITHRRPAPAAAAASLLVAVIITLSVRETLDSLPGLYLSGARFFLPLPMGVWAVLAFTLDAAHSPRPGHALGRSRLRRWSRRRSVAVVVAVAVASTLSMQLGFAGEARALTAVDATPASVVVAVNPARLVATCRQITKVYRRVHAQLLVSLERNVVYGCAAATGIATIDSNYERRGWVLEAAATRLETRILIQGGMCRQIRRSAGRCRPKADGLVLLVTPPRPADRSLALAGMPTKRISGS